jgi:predicted Zn-dependent protease with MMP-like domain
MIAGAAGAAAQAPTLEGGWTQQSPATPPGARFATSLAYDSAHAQVVLFGGFGVSGIVNDTWLWNGTNWTQVFPSDSPTARSNQTMVYDAAQGEVVMFGGATSAQGTSRMNDTWLWNGNTNNWTQVTGLSSTPPARSSAAMAYDAATGQVVLFGGLNTGDGRLGDTWVWNENNWYSESPSASPSARSGASMAYDAALGEVILFGGFDEYGNELNDTWAWTGSNWTQLSPSGSPTGRDSAGMDYDPLLGQVVLFGGELGPPNFTNLGDTWVLTGNSPSNLTWTQQTYSTSPAARATNPMVYDAAEGQMVMFGGYGNSGQLGDTWTWGTPQGFGNINVCQSGAPTPCSNTLTLTYNVSSTTEFLTPQVVTQGTQGLDFSLASGSTCTGSVSAGTTCTVNVTFAPIAPGTRQGAVVLTANVNGAIALVATTPIYGIGGAPLGAFSPLITLVQGTGGQSLTSPEGVAVDAAGDLFIANTGGAGGGDVVKLPAGSNAATTVGSGLNYPESVAVDGAGDVFIGQYAPSVTEIPAGCNTCQKSVGSLSAATAVAVDAAGDLFIGDQSLREVVEVPATNPGSQITLYSPGGSFVPNGLAVDLAGDVYIADSGDKEVLEIPPGGSIPTAVGSGWSSPQSVTLDAAGDLYVADSGLKEVVEIPAGCTVASCQIVVASATEPSLGGNFGPYGVAVDSMGDVYIADLGLSRVDSLLQQFAGLTFSESSVANISGDSPESITLQNIGNQALNAAPPGLVIVNPSFYQVPGTGMPSDCTASFSLAQGADCNLSIDFDPLTSGLQTGNSPFTLTGSALFEDNSLNNASGQPVSLSGTSLANGTNGAEYPLTVSEGGSGSGAVADNMGAISCSESSGSVTGSCSGNYANGAQVTLTANASGGSTFVSWGGACTSTGTYPTCVVTMSQALNVSASFAPQADFGTASVCALGSSNPQCSVTMMVTINFPNNGAGYVEPLVVQVLTEGQVGPTVDFQLSPGGDHCSYDIVSAPGSCFVYVTFMPQAPGLRLGAVVVGTNIGQTVTQLISGIGQAPEAAFGPTITGAYPAVTSSSQVTPVANLNGYSGITTDAFGNLYHLNGPSLLKLAPPYNGTPTTVATGFSTAYSVAIDGAGNFYVADPSLNTYGEVVKLAPGCTSATASCASVIYASSSHPGPIAVAVDGPGNVFIAQNLTGVFEIPANGGPKFTLYNPPGNSLGGMVVDAAGDLFVADSGLQHVVEIPAGCTTTSCQTLIGSGWVSPQDVSVDAAGDVIVADVALTIGTQADAGGLVEVPAGCTTPSCQILLWTSGGAPDPSEVAVTPTGQIFFVTDGTPVYEIDQSQPPAVVFGSTSDGLELGPDPVTIQNIGNQALTGSVGSVQTSNFAEVTSTCNNSFSLTPSTLCTENFEFEPQNSVNGLVGDSAQVSDNSLNGAPATQTISLSGTGASGGASYILQVTDVGSGSGTVTDNVDLITCIDTSGTLTGSCSAGYPSGQNVTLMASPATGSTFSGWGGACVGAGAYQYCSVNVNVMTTVTANFAPAVAYPLAVTPVGTGAGTITDNQAQISCSEANGAITGTCAGNYPSGTLVTLTANSTGTSTFVGWGGACASQGATASCNVTVNSALSVSASFVAQAVGEPGALKPITAGVVYGQDGSFTSGTGNNGGVSANSLYFHAGLTVDANGNLYVADAGNNRVLFYPAGSTTATRVYGQNGSFTTGTANNGGVSANSLWNPQNVAVDSSGNLYVADEYNNRVLFYSAGSTTATRVYGQGGSFTSNTQNNGGVSASSLASPWGLALDGTGNLYVTDYQNNRVLFYPAGSTTATQVYGQGGSFTSNAVNNGGITANSLNQPTGVALDSSGNLYVADIYNNRVLCYPYGSTTATQVYGQGGSFTSNAANTGPGGLNNPMAVALDSSGDLYVVDRSNNRVLFYPFGLTTATRVYGQLNSFASSTVNNGGISANSLSQPWAVALDPSGNLYVTDYSNNRVLEYGSFGNVNVCPATESAPAPCNNTITFSDYAATTTNFGVTQVVTQGATGLDFSLASGSTCTGTVAAGNACTVNVNFAPLAPGLRTGAVELFDNSANLLTTAPTYGIGQAPEITFGPGTRTTINTGSVTLSAPKGILVDAAGNLFISDAANPQVLKTAPNGAQTVFGPNLPTPLQFPQGMAEDGAGNLFIADNNLNEVVEIPAGCNSSCPQEQILPNPLHLRSQLGVAVDGAGDLFIGDFEENKVAEVHANGGAQTIVYSPGSGSHPVDLTTDAAGDLFVADYGLQTVAEVPAGCTVASCQKSIGSGWEQPDGVAVDAAGDVFVADAGLNEVVEVPGGCTTSACQVVLVSGVNTIAVKLDAAGDLFVDNLANRQIFVVNRSQLPSLSFALTNVSSTSTDSPQSVSVQNVGNQPLTGSLNLNQLGANFTQTANPDCSTAFPLAPGAICGESFSFTPQSTGYLTAAATFSDNTLNLSPLVVLQTINLTGNGGLNGQPVGVAVPNVVGLTQAAATTALTGAGLTLGTVSTASSTIVPSGSVSASNPAAGTQVNPGSAVQLLVSSGQPTPPAPNPLSLENNYFVTGDYASAGVTLRGLGAGGMATGIVTIPNYTQSASQGVPDGADIIDAFLYWETVENTPTASATSGAFDGYSITGQQIGSDIPNYVDGALTGTLRAYRADVNTYFAAQPNGVRYASGTHTVSLPDGGGSALPLAEGASLVVIYRVLSPNFPLKSVVIYDGSALSTSPGSQVVQGFYDAAGTVGPGKNTNLSAAAGSWNNSFSPVTLPAHASQFSATLNPGTAYAAVILSTPVTNSDNDGILDAWKAGPAAGDFHAGQSGYYDVKTGSWVPLPGAKQGEKDLFVQLDYMCGALLSDGSCDPTKENLFPAPDAQGNDPLAMVQKAFAATGVQLHLEIGNAVPEDTCTDNSTNPPQLCQFPGQPGVIGWKNSLEFSKLWPRDLAACASGGDCSTRFPYGQKDSYHYVLFGHSLAIPAWNTRYGTLTSIQVVAGVTTIGTTDRGNGINFCPSRITIAGVLGNPTLNGVYNTTGCPDSKTITVATPGVPNWSYPNSTLPEPVIGLTSGTITSISGYSDLGGADSAVTLGLWLTAPNQDMSKRANVVAGTLFHEIGHTLGLSHGGLYYDTANSYVPTFEANCKPNYQSVMNYLFQLDLVGPGHAVAFSNQTLTTLNESTAGSVTQLASTDVPPAAPTFPTSAWYVPYVSGTSPGSPATMHCDGSPLNNDSAYRVDASISPITPAWTNGQDINFDGQLNTEMRGYNDFANIDLRQVGATGGEFASLASVLSFGSTSAPLNIGAGGTVALGSGGTVALGSGGTVTLGSGGNVTLGSGGTITLGSGGNVTLGSGGNVTIGNTGGTVSYASGGTVALGSGGNVTLGSGGTITLGSGGTVALGSGGTVTLGSGGTIALGSGGTVTIPSAGGSYTLPDSGGTITLGSGGTVALGSGGNVTLGSGGTITLGSGGTVALGSGGNVTLGSGGIIALGSGGTVALGSGGNVTLGSGGTVALGSGGTVTLGSGGTVTLGSGGTVTLGSGGNVTLGSGGNVTLGSGGSATLGAGGTVTLGSGGTVALGSGGNVTLSSGGTIALGSGGTVTLGSGGTVTLGSGGTVTPNGGTAVTIGAGGSYTFGSSGGTVALGSGGTVALGSGGNVTLGSGGTITLGSGGTVALGSGGTVTLGSGGNVTLGSGGVVALGSGGTVALGSGGTVALGSGGNVTLGSGGTLSTELTYETANSIVRPPSSPTETQMPAGAAPASVRVDWTAPAFGVVATYTIYRSSDNGPPVEIGSVSGVNGNPPATEFIDTNPDLTSSIVVYTIGTTLLSVPIDPTQRQSPPSPPAVLTNDQTVSLGPPPLPSSVNISASPLTVYATAMSGGAPNGLQVNFSASGPCSIGSQSSTPDANGVSSATVILNSTGNCIITVSQPGTNLSQPGNPPYYNAANSVSGTFAILPLNSTTKSQTISFAQLPNVQYGSTFSLSASSSVGQTVSFATSGPCTTSGKTTGVGLCTITASAPAATQGNTAYSAASVSQSFTIYPAVLTVTAINIATTYGQSPLPALTYTTSPLVNGDPSTAVTGTPALSTTATTGSNAGGYPITVSTGSLAAANYSFLFVSGTLTIQQASQTIAFTTNAPASAAYNSSFTVAASASSGLAVTYSSSPGVCTNSGATYTMTNSAGTCSVTASQPGNTNYSAAAPVTQAVKATGALVTVSPSNINFGTVSLGSITTKSITVANIGTAPVTINQPLISIVKGGNSNEFVAVNLCPSSLAVGKNCTITISFVAGPYYTPQTATLEIMDNAPGSPQPVMLSATVLIPQTITFTTNPPASAAYKSSFTVAATGGASGNPVTFTGSGVCSITGTTPGTATYTMNSTTGTCSVIANQAGNSTYAAAAQVTKSVAATPIPQTITFTANPPASAAYKTTFTVAATGGASGNAVTFTSSGACTNSGATYTMTSGTGTCSVIANQAGNSNYAAATPVTKTVTAAYSLATLTPTSLSFGTVSSGKSSKPLTATLSNTGTTPLIINSIGVTGANAGNFAQTNSCPGSSSSLGAGKSCTISVTFNSSGKAASANLTITDNTQVGTQTVSLSGN